MIKALLFCRAFLLAYPSENAKSKTIEKRQNKALGRGLVFFGASTHKSKENGSELKISVLLRVWRALQCFHAFWERF